ncbi:MAG: hypothetical protein U0930_03695 [Pirellulales bacterium]
MSSYPGGKSGSGVFQRLINLIPPHDLLVVPFAGHCGVTTRIKPASHTIVIDKDPSVCEWWDSWRRSKHGRHLEIHNCCGIEFIRYRFGCTEYSVAHQVGTGSKTSPNPASLAVDADFGGGRSPAFVLADPPYVLSARKTGKIYKHEMFDDDHRRFLELVTSLNASRYRIMICGYRSKLYSKLKSWTSVDHRVQTRGGLQDEVLWLNYKLPSELHDYRYIGDDNRSRERIRRRQENWKNQLSSMTAFERSAMLEALNRCSSSPADGKRVSGSVN